MNSGHRNRGDSADSGQPDVDPADQWVLDPETGEFRLDLDAGRRTAERRPGAGRSGAARSGAARSGAGATAAAGGRSARRRGRVVRGRRVLKWTAGSLGLVLIAGCGGAYYVYQHFNKNISSVKVQVGDESERPQATNDALNLLVIGTDSREGLGREYGDEGSAGHADTTLLFHISKDRSNATVLSIPRDLMVTVPECRTGDKKIPGEARAMFNTSLGQNGRDPGCTWRTVEKLTGVRINHFMMVDFEAVKSLSTAVGGVEVCAATDIDDPYSHLKMTAGRHVVQGEEALAFVRTRHAVGLGGDLTRIPLQQQFISSMIRKMKSSDTLTSPTKLWSLADAATKALTVDSAIDDVNKLKDLALDISRVDTKNITFTTVPVLDDPTNNNHLILKPGDAQQLFAMIAADRSLTDVPQQQAPEPAPSSSAPAPPQVDAKSVKVTVRNGSGTSGQAGKAVSALKAKGFALAATARDTDAAQASTVSYPAGQEDRAQAVAAALGLPATAVQASSRLSAKDGVAVVLGGDYTGSAGASAVPTEAPKDLQRVQADDTAVCASKAK
ncbi:LCP family protein [Kitasatospora sp. NPDC059646]|uniref:LCP family protein n=1 Tax=Kitasatospora sp. NPDC059646 TaxID=3346893 RepID=UPI00368B68B8